MKLLTKQQRQRIAKQVAATCRGNAEITHLTVADVEGKRGIYTASHPVHQMIEREINQARRRR